MGFGIAVLQRLCKTSIKKNLYYEIKDKVFEESFNGVHVAQKKARVKVYGTDSTKEVRARMIELLYERVEMHKDKFISKIILSELQSLEVDKRGKVQAIYPNHDDQVFAYLHALRVWYDGENLAERYGIKKNTIRTDEDVEIEQSTLEQSQALQELDIEYATREEVPEEQGGVDVEGQLNFIDQASRFKLNSDFRSAIVDKENSEFNIFLALNKDARDAYSEKYHIDQEAIQSGTPTISIPENMFGSVFDDDEERLIQERQEQYGNLYDQFVQL